MVRVFAAALDVLLITMLVSFTVDGRERRDFPRKRWYKMAVGAWLLLVASLVLFENSDAPYMLIMMGYMIGCIVALTTQKRLRTLVATLFMVLIAGFPLNIFIFLFNVMGIDIVFGYGDALYALASLMSAVVIFWVWRQRRKFGDELAIRFSVPECLMIVLLFILTMILGLVMNPETGELSQAVLESGSGDFLVATVTALVVFLNVFFLVMVWRNKTTTYYRRLNALNSQFVNSELQYFESYKEAQEDIRTFRHDMKHHMARMAELAEAGDTKALQAYLAQFQQEWQETAYRFYQTGNDLVDALLNGRTAQFRKARITVTIEGAFTTSLALSPFDTCAIFANAIDNALEENERLPLAAARWLHITIKRNEQFYVVTLANPLSGTVPQGRTSKDDALHHGFGLYSIRDKAEKNGGSVDIERTAETFVLTLFLPM